MTFGVILEWLHRAESFHRAESLHRTMRGEHGAPRRLVYALPQHSLTDQVARQVRTWLCDLGLTDVIALHVVPGAREQGNGDWREDMHRPAIVVGTVDVLLSRVLNRGHDTGRVIHPIDFALLTNGAHWVIADARLCPQTTVTLTRVAEFTQALGTAEPFGLTTHRHYPERIDPPVPPPGDALTLVALNTVEAARTVYRHLRAGSLKCAGPPKCTLLHGSFRGIERTRLLADITRDPAGRVVVTTHAVAAGLDLDGASLISQPARGADRDAQVLGLPEFLGLFDTESGVDIAGYISDDGDLDAEVAWADWTPSETGAPHPEIKAPPVEYRCRVPLGGVARLASDRPVWRFDHEAGEWARLAGPPRPGEVLLVNVAAGGYSPESGFDPSAREPVPDSPRLRTPAELAEEERAEEKLAEEPVPPGKRPWQSLEDHSEQVRDQVEALLAALAPGLPPGAAGSAVTAGYLHDAGKAHEIWQDALCALAPPEDAERIAAGRPWAKSGIAGALEFAGGGDFRHELASLWFLDGHLRHLLAGVPDPDLVRYLVLAHHGRLRFHIPDDPDGAWTVTVRSLRDRYGPFILAYLETVVRIADWRASGARDLAEAAKIRSA